MEESDSTVKEEIASNDRKDKRGLLGVESFYTGHCEQVQEW